jgi:hypothetical protein
MTKPQYNRILVSLVFMMLSVVTGSIPSLADCSKQAMSEHACCVTVPADCACLMTGAATQASPQSHRDHGVSTGHENGPVSAGLLSKRPAGCPCTASPGPADQMPVTTATQLQMAVATATAPDVVLVPLSHRITFSITNALLPRGAPQYLTSPRAPPFKG